MKGKMTQNRKAVQTNGDSRSWKLGEMEVTENVRREKNNSE